MTDIYGYVNGKAVYSRDEFIYEARHFGPIESDEELMKFAEKVTSGWYHAGWNRTFTSYYLSTYALDHPYCDLTLKEFNRLKELQMQAEAAKKAAEEARGWHLVGTYSYADNSVEEEYEDKDGNSKTVMVVYPHGDACY